MTEKDKNTKKISIGLDVGTMNICAARSDTNDIKITRNVFLKIDSDELDITELSDISFVRNEEDKSIFIIGEDAFMFANIFSKEVSRPMAQGLISPKEIDAIDVLTLMVKNLIGSVANTEAYCSFSVPAEAIDKGRSVTYHEKIFGRILSSLGVNHTPVNEAMAIVYSECAKEKFSGVGISFGAGLANTCLSGDTKISLLNGDTPTIKELSEKSNNEEFWVYSCKEDGTIVPGLAYNPRKTDTKEVIKITLDNNEYFECTVDHLIMLRDGSYIEAGKLNKDDSMMPIYTEESKWNEMIGYLSVYNNKHKYWEQVHNMVMREHHNIYRKKGYITHHINFCKTDNRPENLLFCKKEDHFKFHSYIAKEYAEKYLKGKTYEEIFGVKKAKEIKEKQKLWRNDKEKYEKWKVKCSLILTENTLKRMSGKTYEEIYGIEKSKEIKELMSKQKKNKTYEEIMNDPEKIEKRKKELSEHCKNQELWANVKNKNNSGTFKKGTIPWNKGKTGEEYKKHFKEGMKNQYTNHKVLKIERTGKITDVYDLSVHEHHNFAIDCGIFVHNCISYKGIEALTFSTSRSGDWIDKGVAESLSIIPNRVTSVKEKSLNLAEGFMKEKNKKTRRVIEALEYYYTSMIEYTIKRIIKEFDDKVDIEIGESIPIIVSGGTSMPPGFLDLFKETIKSHTLPFDVSEIRAASNPLTAVASGLLVKTMSDIK